MARWRLTAAHYILTDPPTEWEHKETSRETGRQTTVRYKVPRLLEPKDPADHNYPDEIIVCDGNNPQRKDIVFLGDPTPDMEPIDDEAKAITQRFIDSGRWKRPEEGEVFGEQLVKQFIDQIAKIQMTQPQPISTSAFTELQAQVKALTEQNAKLQAQMVKRP